MKKDWLDRLAESLENYGEPAPDGLWESVESSLPLRSRKFGFLAWTGVAAAAAAVLLGVFLWTRRDAAEPDTQPYVAEVAAPVSVPAPAPVPAEEVPERVPDAVTAAIPSVRSVPAPASVPVSLPVQEAEPSSSEEAVPVESAVPQEVPAEAASAQETDAPADEAEIAENIRAWNDYLAASASEDEGGQLVPDGAGVSLAQGLNGAASAGLFDPSEFFSGFSPEGSLAPQSGDIQSITRSAIEQAYTVTTTEQHLRPVRVGMSVRWHLTDVFGLETGLVYSRLQSRFRSISGTTVTLDDQRLHYLGLPLHLTVELARGRRFSLYADAGPMVEKCIAGTVKNTVSVSGIQASATTSRRQEIRPLQWSVGAGAGLEVALTNRIGLYAEPGFSYHFDDGTQVRTVYKEHPADFTLTTGLRFNFRR